MRHRFSGVVDEVRAAKTPTISHPIFYLFNTDASGITVFSARASNGYSGSGGDTIIFNEIDVNVGGAYSSLDGIFIAPVDGVYTFSFQILADANCNLGYACAFLVHNSVNKVRTCSEANNSGSSTFNLQLTVGDNVMVTIGTGAPCQLFDAANSESNTFSGQLLYTII